MNKSFFTSIILLFSSPLLAQSGDSIDNFNKNYQIQAGINVVGFVRQFVNFSGNNNNITSSPYSINLKAFKKLTKQDALIGIRLGSGYVNITSSNEEATSSNSNFIETLDFRVGMEFQKSITKKWIGYVGFDYITQKGTNNSVSRFINSGNPIENVTSNNRTTNMDGAGFVFGMQFNFNKRIALATEATYYYSDTKSKTSNFSTNNNNNQPPSTNKNTTTNLILPNLLNFTVLF